MALCPSLPQLQVPFIHELLCVNLEAAIQLDFFALILVAGAAVFEELHTLKE
ncbi:MAG: hypothetical protein LQ343_005674 [Gyalolechia ehrenbergii]|nr:MAG: hypothetical protein LQ343_005674 [Gyalolechia ehrenbergii]